MKARELAELLLRAPEADVVLNTGEGIPQPLAINSVTLNNEANAWIVAVPVPDGQAALLQWLERIHGTLQSIEQDVSVLRRNVT